MLGDEKVRSSHASSMVKAMQVALASERVKIKLQKNHLLDKLAYINLRSLVMRFYLLK